MSRSAKVMGFSLPPETYEEIEGLIIKEHKTRSEFLREMIRVYLSGVNKIVPRGEEAGKLSEDDINKVLKLYYRLIQGRQGETMVIGLAVIEDGRGNVLIGKRKGKDPIKKDLTWVFPGGKMETLDFEAGLAKEVKGETGLTIKIGELVHARVHPDFQLKPVKVIALYYHCTFLGLRPKLKPAGDLVELKWVPATSIFYYFTTSTADEVVRFLNTL